jgi:flavin-dependent dehydrogenase
VPDVLIVGAGPAGAVAGIVLARAGVRVRLVDRATFPRDKLCGDTVNPGTLAHLRRLGISDRIEQCGLAIAGMRVTGEHGIVVEGRYPRALAGCAIVRRDLDWLLLEHAIRSGCEFEAGVAVRAAVVDRQRHGSMMTAVRLGRKDSPRELRARVTIAADGRRSTLAFALGLARHPDRPRRWAIGAYVAEVPPFPSALSQIPGPMSIGLGPEFDQNAIGPESEWGQSAVGVQSEFSRRSVALRSELDRTAVGVKSDRTATPAIIGEMHIRPGRYFGVAALPGGMTRVCLVMPSGRGDGEFRDPAAMLRRELAADSMLRDRFAGARLLAPPVMLGPLAVDISPQQIDGLLLAGDAAGFVDPMTGDGLRFAIEGGELAAAAALDALNNGWTGVHARLAARRRRAFAAKCRFNRALRLLVGSPRAVRAATVAARLVPCALQTIITRAGDCDLAGSPSE